MNDNVTDFMGCSDNDMDLNRNYIKYICVRIKWGGVSYFVSENIKGGMGSLFGDRCVFC